MNPYKNTSQDLELPGNSMWSEPRGWFDELTTALAEIEAVLNSRPLSYVSDKDMEEPIILSHLIVGCQIVNLPDNLDYVYDLSHSEFTLDTNHAIKQVKHLNHVLNQFGSSGEQSI